MNGWEFSGRFISFDHELRRSNKGWFKCFFGVSEPSAFSHQLPTMFYWIEEQVDSKEWTQHVLSIKKSRGSFQFSVKTSTV